MFLINEATSKEIEPSKNDAKQANKVTLIAKRTFVKTGQRRGLDIEITKGVDAGTRVVTSGQLKLNDESPVKISDQDVSDSVDEHPTEP